MFFSFFFFVGSRKLAIETWTKTSEICTKSTGWREFTKRNHQFKVTSREMKRFYHRERIENFQNWTDRWKNSRTDSFITDQIEKSIADSTQSLCEINEFLWRNRSFVQGPSKVRQISIEKPLEMRGFGFKLDGGRVNQRATFVSAIEEGHTNWNRFDFYSFFIV